MMLTKLLEEMMGSTDAEFDRITIMLPLETCDEARDLAAQIGIPTNRLLAELVQASLPEARTEWRRLALTDSPMLGPEGTADSVRFSLDPRIK